MIDPLTGSLKLRQRNSWEAADSGILLWRNNFGFFIILMILPFISLVIFLRFFPPPLFEAKYWSYIILWWLKPLFARPVLHVISVRFFEPQATFSKIMKGFVKSLFIALPGDLLWRRFSVWRAARMPIRTLEHLSGKAARARIQTLETGGLDFGASLTVVTTGIFFAILIGEIFFAVIVLEMTQTIPFSALWQYTETIELLIFSAACFNFILIETLYICMGFGLYINSRIEVEGWDIQLLLQNFEKQKKQKLSSGSSVMHSLSVKMIFFISIVLFFVLSPIQSIQAEQSKIENMETAPIDVLNQILSSPDFGGNKDTWGIRFKNQTEPDMPDIPDINFSWIRKVKDFFGYLLLSLLILTITIAAGYTILRLYRARKNSAGASIKEKTWKSFFVKAGEAATPEEMLAKARLLHDQGMIREAWAKCFLAATAIYSAQSNLDFPLDSTEYDCLSVVKKAKARDAKGFGDLVLSWTSLAYGGKAPNNDDFKKAIDFCNSLNQVLDVTTNHA